MIGVLLVLSEPVLSDGLMVTWATGLLLGAVGPRRHCPGPEGNGYSPRW